MKIEDLYDEWKKDSVINETELGSEAIKLASLHAKYLTYLSNERRILAQLEAKSKRLKREKFIMYDQGASEEHRTKDWEFAPGNRTLKANTPLYMDTDREIVEDNLKVFEQSEKVEYLEQIIKHIANRGYLIKSAIEWQKYILGN